jgi:hypothetical protein
MDMPVPITHHDLHFEDAHFDTRQQSELRGAIKLNQNSNIED